VQGYDGVNCERGMSREKVPTAVVTLDCVRSDSDPSTSLRVIPSLSGLSQSNDQSCSSITWAIANSLEWVSVSSDFVPPIFANRVAAPP
jgi:hypothetical protein